MPEPRYSIKIFPDRRIARISPLLEGACMEDVNHEVYGGIYSQMIFGESFEEEPMAIDPHEDRFSGLSGYVSCRAEREYLSHDSEVRSWQPFRKGTAIGHFDTTVLRCRRGRQGQRIDYCSGEGTIGIENRGLNRWGMNLEADRPYKGTIVVNAAGMKGSSYVNVYVALESADGQTIYDEKELTISSGSDFHTVEFILTPNASDRSGRFSIKLREPATICVDYVLLYPGPWGRYKNTMTRRDIAEALADQGLKVLRYGGCMINTDYLYTEVQVPGSGYRWKKMIGPRPDRPPYRGTFYRYNSNGFGIIDFIALCKALEVECIPAVNPSETSSDLADLIQYLNGGADTQWGARRIADGFSEPFRLRYLQIGNEEYDNIDGKMLIRMDYLRVLRSHIEAIHNVDPTVIPVISPWMYSIQETEYSENKIRLKILLDAVRGFEVLWDVHVGGDGLLDAHKAAAVICNLRRIVDELDLDNKISFCVLEENGGRHDLQRALGHAHMVTTFERLGLTMVDCAANCLQAWKQNDNSWDQGQIFFTPSKVWGMPPFYSQQMLSRSYLPICIASESDAPEEILDVTSTRDESGTTYCVKLLNLSDAIVKIDLTFDGSHVIGNGTMTTLTGELSDDNTPEEPTRIVPNHSELTPANDSDLYQLDLAPYSFTVIEWS